MNKPKVQDDIVPEDGTSPAINPEGRTPLGIPIEADQGDPAAKTTNERFATEIAPLTTAKDEPPPPKR